MFDLEISGWSIALRTALIYLVLLVGLRLAGKRELGQMTPFDLVVILLIANAVQNAMVGPDSSLTGGLIAAGVLIGANFLVAQASDRVTWLRRVVEGTPTVLVSRGEVFERNMRREDVDEAELMAAIREHGLDSLAHVKLAVLEVSGSISVVPYDGSEDGHKTTPTRRRRRFLRR